MGTIQHKALLVTGLDCEPENRFAKAYKKAKKLFPKQLVSKRIDGVTNGYSSFLVAPCGSKVGWEPDVDHTQALEEMVDYLETLKYEDGSTSVEYIHVTFGELGLTVQDHMGHDVCEGDT